MSFIAHPSVDAGLIVQIVPLTAIPDAWDADWRELAANAAEPNAFAESWFMRPSIAHLSPSTGARMVAVRHGPELLGMIPLCAARRYGRLPVRHTTNWLHYHAFLGAPLVREGREAEFWQITLEALDTADWATGFLHVNGLVSDGPVLAGLRAARRADIVHRAERAMLASEMSPRAYLEAHVRKKKRKEIGRLRTRLGELGEVACERDGPIAQWIEDFLALEASGWKGRAGTALTHDAAMRAFFRETIAGAAKAGKLEMLRLTLDGRPIAMLVNFMTAPGSFSFKIAFDEAYARFSPGVLIQIENLRMLDRPGIAWMDSCAVEDHAMINSLWAERREIVRVTVPLKGARRAATFSAARTIEGAAALGRRIGGW
ncbi:MAG: GNAT family N-acetyltransferase [Sphingomonadaceae bacterium]|nr:GNAT family N-acetyltransferase [Sphingomonadaceae bacterium]